MSNEMKNLIIKKNKKLCERYPFLIPRNMNTGKIVENYDYTYTKLDSMPNGWRLRFGEIMCEEIRDELIRSNYLNTYRVFDIKEKYGTLRWYDGGVPRDCLVHDIIDKWSHISCYVCEICGEVENVKIANHLWYESICEKCIMERTSRLDTTTIFTDPEGDPNTMKIECYNPIKGEFIKEIDCSKSWKKVLENKI